MRWQAKSRILQYPFQFFRITHNLNTVALMMKLCSTWALGQILHLAEYHRIFKCR